MRYERFEDLPVWNEAIGLALDLFRLSASGELDGVGDLKNQLERAAISISNNIAEGFERGTNNELINFLYIARGSSGEVRSMLHLLARFPGTEDLLPGIHHLLARAEKVSRQLAGWIGSIKDSGFQGARSQNAQTREMNQRAKRQAECLDKLRTLVDETARNRALLGNGNTNSGPTGE